jgi:selT/selW/selH-like putative selenoprotein
MKDIYDSLSQPMKIEITYCAECAESDQAVDLARKLLARHDENIETLTIVPGDFGVFDVAVDGKLIFSKDKAGRFPSLEEIEKAL